MGAAPLSYLCALRVDAVREANLQASETAVMLNQILQLSRPLLVYDLETTGKDPETARIVEIGMRVHWPVTNMVTSHKTLVNPGISIPQGAVDSHGITDAFFEEGAACAFCHAIREAHPLQHCEVFKPIPTFMQLAPELFKALSNVDFAGYHIKYDLRVTSEEFRRHGYMFDYSKAAIIDSLRLWQILEARTLSDAVEHFLHRKHRGAHSALDDVEETEEVLIAQLTTHPMHATLPRTVAALHEKCWPNQIDIEGKFVFIDGIPSFNFGKHRGKPMTHDIEYLRWMSRGSFSPEVQRIVTAALSGKFPEPKEIDAG